ncbi:E3 ubiquitin-protein ligase RSL1-like [Henckelia pumila]|uniref:E3 ubiquitin-protein ligase RSL1-like n=1 Tax=Henckelia pumila TaxID=405737 RepID=UPI003C6E18D6
MENPTKGANNRPPSTTAHHAQVQHQQEDEFTCEICTETTSLPNKFRNGDVCAHPYCTDCVIKYIGVKLGDENTGHIKCPAPDCDHTLDPLACAPIVGRPLFLRWCDVLCESAIKGWERCYCPHRDCNVTILNECGWKLRVSKCPQCKRWFCFRCKTVWHTMISCEEKREAAEPGLRELAARKHWQRCPSCGQYVERSWGCHVVRCRCGRDFCYNCGRPIYQHSCTCGGSPREIIDLLFILFLVLALIILIPFGALYMLS